MIPLARLLLTIIMAQPLTQSERKALGAYYTDENVVRFLVRWGLRNATVSSAMDPSCGDGRFLAAAAEAGGAGRLVGCDVSPQAVESTRLRLGGDGLEAKLLQSDFFALQPESVAPVDLVVGNPPFIRYQRFDDGSRAKALESALRMGVRLSKRTSSWAPFLLHAVRFLNPDGALAMVVPAEITQARYGLRTLGALLDHFGAVTLLAFERNFFLDAQQDTCLLLAREKGQQSRHVRLVPLSSITDLADLELDGGGADGGFDVAVKVEGPVRFAEAFLKPAERRVWRRLKGHDQVRSLASLATVTNGYVTGDNEFFHRTREVAETERLPPTWLFPVARSSKSLRGLLFEKSDVADLESRGLAHHLILPQEDLFLAADRDVLNEWLAQGSRRGTPQRFKCRSRDPWWRVPGLQKTDVLIGYMSGAYPRAAVNRCGAYYTNSLHGLRLFQEVPPELIVLGFYSSLTLLSLEIEGRSYGGGILKVEPRELDRALLPLPEAAFTGWRQVVHEVDRLLRDGRFEDANRQVDAVLLKEGLGLTERDVQRLREARERLMQRRLGRRL